VPLSQCKNLKKTDCKVGKIKEILVVPFFHRILRLIKGTQQSLMNMICLLLWVSHWPTIMVGPGGLPLEVSPPIWRLLMANQF
jgi:hypothetical protein